MKIQRLPLSLFLISEEALADNYKNKKKMSAKENARRKASRFEGFSSGEPLRGVKRFPPIKRKEREHSAEPHDSRTTFLSPQISLGPGSTGFVGFKMIF